MVTRALLVSIVDDDEGVRMATGGLVESFGYDVRTFDSGEAFLGSEWLEKTRCLIADVQMPGISGPELYEYLLKSGKQIPVIFITAFPRSSTRDQVRKRGAVAYLTKPFDREALLNGIRRAIGDDEDGRSAHVEPKRINEMQPKPRPGDRCVFVIFGAAGDLTKRLLVPALRNLRHAGLLPKEFAVIGVSRRGMDNETFRRDLDLGVRRSADEAADDWLAERVYHLQGELNDPAAYENLNKLLAATDEAHRTGGNYLFYLATPAQMFATIVKRLGDAGLVREEEGHWRRVIIEKPFGVDLPSAQALDRDILGALTESQVYRIDHYLGKETVQNLLVFRFANGIFEPLWNRNHIDHVQITVAESLDVERRGRFYDATGALRDMVPNHLFQLLTLTAMEPPTCFDAEAVRSEKAKVLEGVRALGPDEARRDVVRGQYGAGIVDGKKIEPYRRAADVASDSATETYVALKLAIDSWRWAGVPFYLRTGKALAARRTEIAIQFKQAPFALFRDTPVERLTPNDLLLQIQPEEGMTLRFSAKIPGPNVNMDGVEMRHNYKDHFKSAPNTGYETLIYDCMIGDATLFQRADNIEAGWRVVQPVLEAWARDGVKQLPIYTAGSSGPSEADALLMRDGRRWRPIDRGGAGNSS